MESAGQKIANHIQVVHLDIYVNLNLKNADHSELIALQVVIAMIYKFVLIPNAKTKTQND